MDYEVIRRLARGGMGVVDLAQRPDGTRCALKRLALHGTADEMRLARARFERELAVLRRLDHDAVVPLLDVHDDGGELVLVMPYLAGGNLAERVRADGPLEAPAVRAIADRLLPALAAAHRLGIVHRDIKPANVLFDTDGRAYLADFGVASTRDTTDGLTQTGTVLGTPGFLAPEQARGEPITAASDICALGATLHFAATGASPYAGGDAHAVLLRTAQGRASVDRSIDRELRRTLVAMLHNRPSRRPSAAALAGGPDDTMAIPTMATRRPKALVALVAAVLVAGVVSGIALTRQDSDADASASSPTTDIPADACQPLPYQPCGRDAAPNTDGQRCVGETADYDGIATNGCEAEPDDVDGDELVDRLVATIVPADDVDRYPVTIVDEGDVGCNNTVRVTITAPTGTSLRLEVLDDSDRLAGEAISAEGVPGEVAIRDPRCFRNDDATYTAVVTPTGSDRSGAAYTLTRSGSF